MTTEEYKDRYCRTLCDRTGVSREFAEADFDGADADTLADLLLEYTPEEAVEENLECWASNDIYGEAKS